SRLFEEGMRRYQMKYHVVGGFSFYERAEIKDMISYLKLIQNPDDSIALLRVINTPTRGIGKTTLDTLERMALETGLSLWNTITHAIEGKLLPLRALAALQSFKELIEDGRAIVAGTFHARLATDETSAVDDQQVVFDPAAFGAEEPSEEPSNEAVTPAASTSELLKCLL